MLQENRSLPFVQLTLCIPLLVSFRLVEDMAEKNPRFEIGKYEAEFMLKEGNKY